MSAIDRRTSSNESTAGSLHRFEAPDVHPIESSALAPLLDQTHVPIPEFAQQSAASVNRYSLAELTAAVLNRLGCSTNPSLHLHIGNWADLLRDCFSFSRE